MHESCIALFFVLSDCVSENTPQTQPTYPAILNSYPVIPRTLPTVIPSHYTVMTGLSRNPLPLDETLAYSQPPPFNYGVIVNSEEVGTLGYIMPSSVREGNRLRWKEVKSVLFISFCL